jgi:superfamily II DNA or RNA helicase
MREVKVSLYSGALFIDPWIPQLAQALSYSKLTKQDKWPYKYLNEKKYMYTTDKASDGRHVGLTYEGMWWEVLSHLRRMGIEPVWEDHRGAIPEADLTQLQTLRPLQDKALDVILNNHIGIIECPPGFGKTFLISQLPRIYPDSRIVIITPRTDVVEDIYRRVAAAAPEPKEVRLAGGGKKFPTRSRVVVITAGSVHKIPPDWPHILIYDEVHGCATPRQLRSLEQFEGRRYGLSASPDGRLDGADLEVNGIFGPVVCRVSYQDAQEKNLVCPIHVRMVNIDSTEPVAKTDVKKQRLGYWQNEVRNRAIAELVRGHSPDEPTLILVKTLEHALHLRMLIPEFFIVHGGVPDTPEGDAKWESFCREGLVADTPEFIEHIKNVDTDKAKAMFADGRIKKVIATPKWREGVDFPELRILVRADGSSGSIDAIQILGRLSRVVEGKTHGIVYDFIDNYGESYLRKSKTRKKHYEKQGWRIEDSWKSFS